MDTPTASDVVIVTHNSGGLLEESVLSAVDQAGPKHVWVLDAESTDGSVESLRERVQDIHLLSVPNRGFAAANNLGMASTTSPLVMLLNPDAALYPEALDALVATAVANPRAGIVGATVLNPDGSVQANSFGRFPTLVSATGLRLWRLWQRLRGDLARAPRAPSTTRAVDWVTGAAMLVRREAIQEVGLLDEGFFLYYEDIDWCWRMNEAGWEVLLEPSARVVHHLGGSAAPSSFVDQAYRDSFYRYCDLRRLWGLKTAARVGLTLRRATRGRP